MIGNHGRPSFAGDQAAKILQLLREAGPQGVSKRFLIFECGYTQCGARIWELERRGYQIHHEQRPGDRYVTFVLIAEPDSPKADWFETQTGKRRPADPQVSDLPLFAEVRS